MEKNYQKESHSSGFSVNRRQFIGGLTAAAAGFSVVPAHVLGGNGRIAPSDKINVAYIG